MLIGQQLMGMQPPGVQMDPLLDPMSQLPASQVLPDDAPQKIAKYNKDVDKLAEELAASEGEPPDLGMLAGAIAGALPGPQGPNPNLHAPGAVSLGAAPQMQTQINPFVQPPATGTTHPGLGNLLKGITA